MIWARHIGSDIFDWPVQSYQYYLDLIVLLLFSLHYYLYFLLYYELWRRTAPSDVYFVNLKEEMTILGA